MARLAGRRPAPPRAHVVTHRRWCSVGRLPATDGLLYPLADGYRVIVRPSGTEPKLKCYLEVVEPVEGDVTAARSRAALRLAALTEAFRAATAP